MKRFLYLLASFFSITALNAPVFAQQSPTSTVLYCGQGEQIPVINTDKPATDTPVTCDLALKKEVSINGTDFFDANSADTAPQANINDVVTYKITVKDATAQPYYISSGVVVVEDILPSSLSLIDTVPNTGIVTDGVWTYSYQSSATLVVHAKVLASGNINNTAILNTNVDQNYASCDGPCFTDMGNGNNTDNAYIVVKAKPQVLGATTATLADTGSSLLGQTIVASAIILLTIYIARRKNVKKL